MMFLVGTRSGIRTRTPLSEAGDFKSPVSTVSPPGRVLRLENPLDHHGPGDSLGFQFTLGENYVDIVLP